MNIPLCWGIIAPGIIAAKFVEGLSAVDDAVLYAVASRDIDRAKEFASNNPNPGLEPVKAYGSYEELAEDPAVDAVYIASPHPFHAQQALLCLNNKKPVLCEKPLTVNAKQAEAIIRSARDNNTFCMEALWSRYLPAIQYAKQYIEDGSLGDIRMIRGDFSFDDDVPDSHRLLNPALAGGALLDVGIYPLSLSSFFMGSLPDKVSGFAEKGPTGVDIQEVISLSWDTGQVAALTCGVKTKGPITMEIIGTKGVIEINRPFFAAESLTILDESGPKTIEKPHICNGYEYEAIEVARCLENGLKESPVLPLEESLGIVKIMDKLRAEWDIKYPFE